MAVTAAWVFALQLLISGLALGASPVSFSDSFVCAENAPIDGAGGAPVAPMLRHHVSCCILHQAAVDEPPLRSAVAVALVEPTTGARVAPSHSGDALKTAPELAPLSARAPPLSRA